VLTNPPIIFKPKMTSIHVILKAWITSRCSNIALSTLLVNVPRLQEQNLYSDGPATTLDDESSVQLRPRPRPRASRSAFRGFFSEAVNLIRANYGERSALSLSVYSYYSQLLIDEDFVLAIEDSYYEGDFRGNIPSISLAHRLISP
jgi:hypothetical protein